jgi:hypothetical protein
MIENVEELGTKLEVGAIPDLVDREILEEREIEVELAGPSQYADASVAESRCHGWAVSVWKNVSGRTTSGWLFIAYDRGALEAALINVVEQLRGGGTRVYVLSGAASSRDGSPVRRYAIDALGISVGYGEIVAGLEYRDTLN